MYNYNERSAYEAGKNRSNNEFDRAGYSYAEKDAYDRGYEDSMSHEEKMERQQAKHLFFLYSFMFSPLFYIAFKISWFIFDHPKKIIATVILLSLLLSNIPYYIRGKINKLKSEGNTEWRVYFKILYFLVVIAPVIVCCRLYIFLGQGKNLRLGAMDYLFLAFITLFILYYAGKKLNSYKVDEDIPGPFEWSYSWGKTGKIEFTSNLHWKLLLLGTVAYFLFYW